MKKDVLKRLTDLSGEQITEVLKRLSLTEVETIRESFSDNTDDRDRDDDDASRGYVPEDPQIEVYGAATDTEERFLKGRQLVFYSVEETDTMEEFKLYQYVDDSEGLQVKHKNGGEVEPWQMIIGLAIDVDGESGNNQITLMYVLNKSGRKAKIEYERCNLKSILKDFLSDQGLTLFKDEDFDNDFGSDEEDEIKGAEVSSDINTDGVQDVEDDDEEKMAAIGSDKGINDAYDPSDPNSKFFVCSLQNDGWQIYCKNPELYEQRHMIQDIFKKYFKKNFKDYYDEEISVGSADRAIRFAGNKLIKDFADEYPECHTSDFVVAQKQRTVNVGESNESKPVGKTDFPCAVLGDKWRIFCVNPELVNQKQKLRDLFDPYVEKYSNEDIPEKEICEKILDLFLKDNSKYKASDFIVNKMQGAFNYSEASDNTNNTPLTTVGIPSVNCNFTISYNGPNESMSESELKKTFVMMRNSDANKLYKKFLNGETTKEAKIDAIRKTCEELVKSFCNIYNFNSTDFEISEIDNTQSGNQLEAAKQYAINKPYYIYNVGMSVIFYKGDLNFEQEEMFDSAFESHLAPQNYNKYMEDLGDMDEIEASEIACGKMIDDFIKEHPEFKRENFFIQENDQAVIKNKRAAASVSEASENEEDEVEYAFETEQYTIVYTGELDDEKEEFLAKSFESEEALVKYEKLLEISETELEACQKMIDTFVEENPDYKAEDFYVDEYLPRKNAESGNVFEIGDDVTVTYLPNDLSDNQIEIIKGFFGSDPNIESYEKMKKSDGPEEAAKSIIVDFCQDNVGYEVKDFEVKVAEKQELEENTEDQELEENTEDQELEEGVTFPQFSIGNYCKISYTGGQLTNSQSKSIDEFFGSNETYMSFKQLGQNEDAARTLINDLCEKYHEFDAQDFDVKIESGDDQINEDDMSGSGNKQVYFDDLFQGENEDNAIEMLMDSEIEGISSEFETTKEQVRKYIKYMNNHLSFDNFYKFISKTMFGSFVDKYNKSTNSNERLDCTYTGFKSLGNGNICFIVDMPKTQADKWLAIARNIDPECDEREIFFVIAQGVDGIYDEVNKDIMNLLVDVSISQFLDESADEQKKVEQAIFGGNS